MVGLNSGVVSGVDEGRGNELVLVRVNFEIVDASETSWLSAVLVGVVLCVVDAFTEVIADDVVDEGV